MFVSVRDYRNKCHSLEEKSRVGVLVKMLFLYIEN
jgi:hypothetical protein